MTRRTVMFVLPDLGLGGAQVVAVRLAEQLHDRGDEVVLAPLADWSTDSFETPSGVQRVKLPTFARRFGPVGLVVRNVVRGRRFRALVAALDPDAIIAFVDSTNLFTLLMTIGRPTPVIVSERVDPREHRITGYQRLLRRLLYPRAAALVVQTERVADWGSGVVPQRRVRVIPNPVPRPEARRCPSVPETIVAAGRFVPQKGFDLLIEAFARVRTDGLRDWRLTVLGDGEQRRDLEAQVKGLGLARVVAMPGQVADVAAHLSRASLFVLSSRFEGFPNALTEAMAWGVPVVAFDCPTGPRELIEDGVNGRLVPAGDVAALATAMREMMESASARDPLGEAGRRSIERFEPSRIADAWDGLIGEVTSHVRHRRRR